MGLLDFFRARFSRAKPTQDAFAELALEQIRQRGLAQDCRYDREQFRILSGGHDGNIFYLHNAYHDYCRAAPKDRAQLLQKYLAFFSIPKVPSSFSDARVGLMPVIRSKRLSDQQRLQALYEPERALPLDAWQALGEEAIILLAYDTELSIQTISQTTLTQWGVTFDAALAVAMDNLRDRTAHSFVALGDGLLMGAWGDAYDSSRLLLPDLLYRACQGGEPLVMVPTRDRILLVSSNNVVGQLAMVALADKLMREERRQVSSAMYGVQQGQIVACQPSDAGVAAALRRFQTMVQAELYNEQKEELERLNNSTGEDVFVASCLLLQREGSEHVVSLASWAMGVDTLLPRTDIVGLEVRDENGVRSGSKMLAWDDAQAIGGGLMEQVDCYPVRYRVRAFPDQQCLAAAPEWVDVAADGAQQAY